MAQVLPSIQVTDARTRDGSLDRQDAGRLSKAEGTTLGTTLGSVLKTTGPLASGKLASKLRIPTSPPATNDQATLQNAITLSPEGRRPSEAAIDPLSQQILQRTNTAVSAQRLRTQLDNTSPQSPTSPNHDTFDTKQTAEAVREIASGLNNKPEKKKGVSFLSRFIPTKKKGTVDGGSDDGSEAGDSRRPEGMDAQLFRHPVDNMGFSPKYPQPPAYIKVRSKFQKEKQFDRLFLAQELRSPTDTKKSPPAAGANPAPQSGSAANHNPTWATEFSKDGKHLAAGGQDRIVRVWTVISTPEERRTQEREESDPATPFDDGERLSAPVFHQKPIREYHGHTATILDLSWSKNNFLLSSSMDKTVRLWHISRNENLCTFKHTDFVPSIQFHPRDDRFFLAGSLDCKLRLWSIPDKSVAFWNQLPDMITAVSFTPDGKTCIAGTLSGLCMFYETEGLKYQTQIHVKSTRGQNAKGSKITGIQATHWPPGSDSGEVKLLISSNDSRVRLYNLRDKSLEMKFRGHENNCSQIRASFADDTGHIICGSEDRKAYIWSTSAPEGEKRNQRPVEMFEAHNSITTCAVMAPLKTRQLLGASEDPIFDLCNPPPVTLISRAESVNSSRAPTESGSALPTPATDANFRRVAETPAYIARSAHTDGNIIVTADYTGALKVFRQDCAYSKRLRLADNADTASVFSKRTGSRFGSGRPSSVMSRSTVPRRRDSTSTQPPNDRIMSWRQDISHGSFDSVNGGGGGNGVTGPRRSQARSASPRKAARASASSIRPDPHSNSTTALGRTPLFQTTGGSSPKTSLSQDRTLVQSSEANSPPRSNSAADIFDPAKPVRGQQSLSSGSNPLAVYNGQSWAFWNNNGWKEKLKLENSLAVPGDRDSRRHSAVSRLSAERSPERSLSGVSRLSAERSPERSLSAGRSRSETESVESEHVRCRKCGADEFRVKAVRIEGVEERRVVCGGCGTLAD